MKYNQIIIMIFFIIDIDSCTFIGWKAKNLVILSVSISFGVETTFIVKVILMLEEIFLCCCKVDLVYYFLALSWGWLEID